MRESTNQVKMPKKSKVEALQDRKDQSGTPLESQKKLAVRQNHHQTLHLQENGLSGANGQKLQQTETKIKVERIISGPNRS